MSAETQPATFTERLAERVCAMEARRLSDSDVQRARHALLDWIATAAIGSREESAAMIRRLITADGGTPHSTVIGTQLRVTEQQAALANGQAAHAIDYDDSYPPAQAHGTACILSAAFPLAEARDSSLEELCVAVLAGFDALALLGAALGPSHYARGFHNTGTLGAIAATAAAARMLGLSAEQTAGAFSLAAGQAAGVKASFGTMAKPLNAGRAAATAILSARLAAEAFTAPADVIGAPVGFAATHSDEFVPERAGFPDAPGSGIRPNIFKFHACCHQTHSSLEGTRRIAAESGIDPAAVESITLEVAAMSADICANPAPRTGLEAKFSLAQVAAIGLLQRDTGPTGFTDATAEDPQLVALRDRVQLRYSPDRTMFRSRVTVRDHSGAEHTAEVDMMEPSSDAQLPEEGLALAEKTRGLASPVLGGPATEQAIRFVLAGAPSTSVQQIAALLRTG